MKRPKRRPVVFVAGCLAVGIIAAAMARAEQADPLLQRACWIWWDKDTNAIREPYRLSEFSFTKEYSVDGEIRKATLRVTAESVYTLFINGKQVGADDNW